MPPWRRCPTYYWLDIDTQLVPKPHLPPLSLRASDFLQHPRIDPHIAARAAWLHVCRGSCERTEEGTGDADGEARAGSGLGSEAASGRRTAVVRVSGAARASDLARELAPAAGRPLLWVRGAEWLTHLRAPDRTKEWCPLCPTRVSTAGFRGIRTAGRIELEQFCRAEARGELRLSGGARSCCNGTSRECHPEASGQCSPRRQIWRRHPPPWLQELAQLEFPPPYDVASGDSFRCRHPLCSGV